MFEDKILELRNYGFSVEDITKTILLLYNKNPFDLWSFKHLTFTEMKKLVIAVLLNIN